MFILMIDQFQRIKIRIWLRYSLFFCFLSPSVVAKYEFYTVTYRNWSITGQFSHYLMHGSLLWDPFYIIRKSIVVMTQQTVVHCIIWTLVRASHPVREVKSTRDENEKQPRMETLQVLILIWFIHRCNDSDHEYFKSFGLLPVTIVTNRNKQWEQHNHIQLLKEALFIIRINRLLCTELALIFDNSSRVTCVQYSGCMYNLYITERFYSQASLQMVPHNYMYI